MKSKAYVAIHHSKALPLSIVRGPFSQSFIKEYAGKSHKERILLKGYAAIYV